MEHYSTLNPPSVSKSIRLSYELWERISEFVENGSCKDFSEATRKLIGAGLWLHDHKDDIQDPEKVNKIIHEWNVKMNEKDIFDWVHQLPESQMIATFAALEMEKESRNKSY